MYTFSNSTMRINQKVDSPFHKFQDYLFSRGQIFHSGGPCTNLSSQQVVEDLGHILTTLK